MNPIDRIMQHLRDHPRTPFDGIQMHPTVCAKLRADLPTTLGLANPPYSISGLPIRENNRLSVDHVLLMSMGDVVARLDMGWEKISG